MTNKMKIIENEENNENKKAVEIDNHDGKGESQGSGNTPDTKIMFGKVSSTQYRGRRKPRKSVAHSAVKLSDVSEEPLDDGNVAVKVEDRVPVVTPRGRGRPRKNTLVSDAVSPLAKVSATPSHGRGKPRKDTSLSESPLKERRGRGRPKKIVDASDVSTTLEKSDAELNTDGTDLQTKDDSIPHRGRGRPRKNFGNIIRGRGRPRKNFGSIIRGRGRPRKNFGSLGASTSSIEDKADSTPSRGSRGSARKILKNTGATTLTKGTVGHQNDFKRFGAIQLLAQALAKHGRGRPRKGTGIKDAVQLLQKDPVLSKPGRGRPPKSIKRIFAMKLLAKATDTSRRGRGRPRKVVVAEKDPSVTPRGRGRPRKNLGTPSTTLLSGAAVTPVTPMTPRGRGRPRKNPPAADAVLSSKAAAVTPLTPMAPRGRGRPRKNPPTADAVLSSEVTEPVTGSSESVETMSDVQLDIKPKIEIL